MQISSAIPNWVYGGPTDTTTPQTSARGQSASDQDRAATSSTSDDQRTATTTESASSSAASKETRETIQSARAIFANYDLTSISANEIDQLTQDLKSNRFGDLGFVMSIERQGASYRNEMENSGSVYGIGDAEFDPDAKFDLIEKTRTELSLATRYGQDTERLSSQLFKLEEAQMSRPSSNSMAAPTTEMAETLVLFQAQRLWVE